MIAAAFDGPLRSDLAVIGRYRLAERMLTVGLQPLIGKPGQASAPIGKMLNHNANVCARIVLEGAHVASASHTHAIHSAAIVEAFPSAFLGVLIEQPKTLNARRGDRSDTFYMHLAREGVLQNLVERLLPGHRPKFDYLTVTNHDDRAGLVCALTALCVAANNYVAVGDDDGWIILPPRSLIQSWAWDHLTRNSKERDGLFQS